MAYQKQNFKAGLVLKAEHLNHIEEGIAQLVETVNKLSENPDGDSTGNCNIGRIESNINGAPLVNFRDIESGTYILYGYFSPYENSDISISSDNSLVSVIWKNAGSHLICLDPLNAKIVFFEILVDETEEKGFKYTRTIIPLLDVYGLLDRVSTLEQLGGSGGGADGYSPLAVVNETTEGATITITDKNGITSATVKHGKDGKDANEVVVTTGSGSVYEATVPNITALTTGVSFVMIPHTASTIIAPKLNVNGLGEKSIRRRLTNSTVSTVAASSTNWLAANKPIRMMYDGSYWIADLNRPNATDLYGTVAIEQGGTGATTEDGVCSKFSLVRYAEQTLTEAQKEQARVNIGAQAELTEEDIQNIAQQVIEVLGTPVFGTVDENNNIVLTGNLEYGTYSLKYEKANGDVVDVGTLENTEYTNKLRQAIDSDNTPYNNGQGWKTGYRLNSSGVETELDGMEVTGFIPVSYGDTVYLSDIGWDIDSGNMTQTYLWAYDSSFTPLAWLCASDIFNGYLELPSTATVDGNGCLTKFVIDSTFLINTKSGSLSNVAYIRLNCESITNDSIVTVNQTIQ